MELKCEIQFIQILFTVISRRIYEGAASRDKETERRAELSQQQEKYETNEGDDRVRLNSLITDCTAITHSTVCNSFRCCHYSLIVWSLCRLTSTQGKKKKTQRKWRRE